MLFLLYSEDTREQNREKRSSEKKEKTVKPVVKGIEFLMGRFSILKIKGHSARRWT